MRGAVSRLVGAKPRTVAHDAEDALIDAVARELTALDWVESAKVRLREEGHVLFGEASVVARDTADLPESIADACRLIRERHWRMHDLTITIARR